MQVLIADSTGQWTWVPPVVVDTLELVATDPAGTVVDLGDPTLVNGVWVLDIQSADVPASKVGRWTFDPKYTVTPAGEGPQTRSDPRPVWLLSRPQTGYGDFDRVRGYLGKLITITATSDPTMDEILNMMDDESVELDLRLNAAGYAVPVPETSGARSFVDHVVSLFTVGSIYERLAAARQPGSMPQAETYRKRAEAMIARALEGDIVFGDVERDSTHATTHSAPTVVVGTPLAITTDRIERFVEWHGVNR